VAVAGGQKVVEALRYHARSTPRAAAGVTPPRCESVIELSHSGFGKKAWPPSGRGRAGDQRAARAQHAVVEDESPARRAA
jgi:hypothetical protein